MTTAKKYRVLKDKKLMTEAEQRKILENYSAGKAGTRDTIEKIGGQDYADLLIALGRYDLRLPLPYTKGREKQIHLASELLRPLLQKPQHG